MTYIYIYDHICDYIYIYIHRYCHMAYEVLKPDQSGALGFDIDPMRS